MVTRLIVSGIAFGVRVRRTARSPTGRKLGAERAAMLDRERPPQKRTATAAPNVPEQKIGHGAFIRPSFMLEALCQGARACCVRASRPRDPTMVFSRTNSRKYAEVRGIGQARFERHDHRDRPPSRAFRRALARLSTGHIFCARRRPASSARPTLIAAQYGNSTVRAQYYLHRRTVLLSPRC